MSRKEVNFKSKLIEWSQKYKHTVSFELIEQQIDKDHSPVFHTEVKLEGISAGYGKGYSKKESQQNAAQMALAKLRNDARFKEEIAAAKQQKQEDKQLTDAVMVVEDMESQASSGLSVN